MEISSQLRMAMPPGLSRPARSQYPAENLAPPQEQLTRSEPAAHPHLGAWGMLGLATLGVLGGMATRAEAAVPTPRIVAEAPAVASTPTPGVKPLATPTLTKGDYVKHGVNFSQLLSDREFTDVTSTDAQDLTRYFKTIDSWMADTPVDGEKMGAEVIMEAAREHQVNPWVLVATLEKETGLVSRTAPPAQKTLRKSMGYAYHDGGGKAGKHSNFSYQVDRGARLLRELFEEGQSKELPRSMTVDYGKRQITVRNAATWALMRYTPHTVDTKLSRLGGGNFLFRKHIERMVATSIRTLAPVVPTTITDLGN